jgi:hypothetical protein
MSTLRETAPLAVPATAQQGGEVVERWLWTESAVWTERMLTALEEGVKGGIWFRLIDSDHQRWPNSFFAEQGYYSLEAAYAAARQSPSG